MSAPDPQRLNQLLDSAVNAWTNPSSLANLLGSWRGNRCLMEFVKNNETGQPNCIVLVEYARWARSASGTSDALDRVKTACDQILQKKPGDNLGLLVHAITHAVLAVLYYDSKNTPKFAEYLGKSALLYDHAWELSQVYLFHAPTSKSTASGPDLSLSDLGTRLMDFAQRCGAFGTQGVTSPTWQTLLALVGHLVGEKQTKPIHRNQPKALFISQDHVGHVIPFTIDKVDLSVAVDLPCYLDPLSFGVTRLDPSLRLSIWLAARCAKQASGRQATHSLRIACDLSDKLTSKLTGSSAGGLVAASMVAAMNQQQIDPQKSTTCRLWFRNPTRALLDETNPIEPEDLELVPILGTVNKLNEAWQVAHGLNEFFLVDKNYKEWNTSHPDSVNPKVTQISRFVQLIHGLMGSHALDEEIQRHARKIYDAWDKAIAWKEGDPEIPEAKLADLGFRFYIAPDLRIEGPLVGKSEAKEGGKIVLERDETPIPNDGNEDASLLNLLDLTFRGTTWSDAPDWLHGHGNIVIYDNAGAGKTVCSHRVCRVLCNPENWERLFINRTPPLVVRIEGRWPKEFGSEGRLLSLRETIARLFHTQADRIGPEQSLLVDRIVDHALRTRRVCLIIDGLDQMPPEDCEHLVDIYDQDHDSANCHWIVFSRVHKIDEVRAGNRIFDDKRWRRVRINLFSPGQQDQYFEIPDEQGRVIGDRWIQTLADRKDMGELLGLPMVLWMIRLLIEESDPLPVFSTLSQLYLITTRKLLARAIEKNSSEVEKKLSELRIPTPFFRNPAEKLEALEHVLSLIAFQMMLLENYNGSLQDKDQVKRLIKLSEYRYTKELRDRFERANEFDRRKILGECDSVEHRWNWAVEVLKTIELSHRSVVEGYSDAQIAFRSRKMLECHAARYLTRYASLWDIYATDNPNDMPEVSQDDLDQDLSTLCAWNYTTHPQWHDLWRLAIDMPQEPITSSDPDGVIQGAVLDPVVTCRTLSALFRQPKSYVARDIRPTKLIYMAWHLFEYDDSLLQRRLFYIDGELKRGAELSQDLRKQLGQRLLLGQTTQSAKANKQRLAVLEEFRDAKSRQMQKEFEDRFDTILVDGQRIAIPWDENDRKAKLAKWQEASSWEKSRTLLQCPPKTWIQAYQQAQERGNDSLKDPCVNSSIQGAEAHRFKPFRMASTSVTREMYRQFDPAFENTQSTDWMDEGIKDQLFAYASPFGDDQQKADFPIIFTNYWDGWVFCKWLGSGFFLPHDQAWEFACRAGTSSPYHFGNQLDGKLANCDGNRPYGIDAEGHEIRNLAKGPYLERTTPVGLAQYPCNAFGMFDVHGNTWEWCENSVGDSQAVESSRLLVGGSWFSLAKYCCSQSRYDGAPGHRSSVIGFRICCF